MSAANLYTAGYRDLVSVIPPKAELAPTTKIRLESRGKAPGKQRLDGRWVGYPFLTADPPTPRDIRQWTEWGANVGIQGRHFPGLDIDSEDATLTKFVVQEAVRFLGDAPVRTSREPRRLLVYRTDNPFPRQRAAISFRGQEHMIEMLGEGRQYLVHGYHPSGTEYGWEKQPLWGWAPDTLTPVDAEKVQAFFEHLKARLGGRAEVRIIGSDADKEPPPPQESLLAPSLDLLREVVEAIPNDYPDRETYIRVGYAVKAAAGPSREGEAFDIWSAWASKWEHGSNEPETMAADWSGMKGPYRSGWDYLQGMRGAASVVAAAEFAADPDADPEDAPSGGAAPRKVADADNAQRLVEMHGDKIRYVVQWGRWLVWQDGRWVEDPYDVYVSKLAMDVGHSLREQAASLFGKEAEALFKLGTQALQTSRIANMVRLARSFPSVQIHHEQLDADPWLLGVRNGVVDLRTGKLRGSKPEDLVTMQCPVDYRPAAQAPRWEQAMEEWFPDAETRAYVQRLAGAALHGGQKDHIFVIDHGHGRNGKGTYTRAVQRVLGPYCVLVHKDLLAGTRDQHDTVKAALFRARLAFASETQRRVRLREESIKALTGGDRIQARRMREDPWEFNPTHMLRLNTNYLPQVNGRDEGIWRRIRVVEWISDFEGREDKGLDDRLAAEAPGILRWMIEGCIAWQERGLDEPEAVLEATADYRSNEDTCTKLAADSGWEFGEGYEARGAEVQQQVNRWKQATGSDMPYAEVTRWLETDMACSRTRTRHGIVWRGIRTPEGEDEWET